MHLPPLAAYTRTHARTHTRTRRYRPVPRSHRQRMPPYALSLQVPWVACWAACTPPTWEATACWGLRGGDSRSSAWRQVREGRGRLALARPRAHPLPHPPALGRSNTALSVWLARLAMYIADMIVTRLRCCPALPCLCGPTGLPAVSLAIGAFTLLLAVDPRQRVWRTHAQPPEGRAVAAKWPHVRAQGGQRHQEGTTPAHAHTDGLWAPGHARSHAGAGAGVAAEVQQQQQQQQQEEEDPELAALLHHHRASSSSSHGCEPGLPHSHRGRGCSPSALPVVHGYSVEGGAARAAGRATPLTWERIGDMVTMPTFLIIILQVGSHLPAHRHATGRRRHPPAVRLHMPNACMPTKHACALPPLPSAWCIASAAAGTALALTCVGSQPAAPVCARNASFARLPSLPCCALQGIVGTTPWNAMVFLTLYMQLLVGWGGVGWATGGEREGNWV